MTENLVEEGNCGAYLRYREKNVIGGEAGEQR